MRKLSIILTLLSLAFSVVASAVEYVTVNDKNRVTLNPTDIFEIVGIVGQPHSIYMKSIHHDSDLEVPMNSNVIGQMFTGISYVRSATGYAAILKITKASEINKVGPTSVLVLPENARGNYDLIVEASSDSVTWTPFHSQAVESVTAKRLFRVRIVHKGQEEAAAKGEEK